MTNAYFPVSGALPNMCIDIREDPRGVIRLLLLPFFTNSRFDLTPRQLFVGHLCSAIRRDTIGELLLVPV